MPATESKLIIFAKAPIPGTVKTRLQPTVSRDDAATLQMFFIQQTLNLASSLKDVDVELRCAPNDSHPFFQQCARHFDITIKQQQGTDLGERMANALQEALTNYQQVIVIGTDCPELSAEYLLEAFSRLNQGTTAVIGPASDGGYVLLGLRCYAPSLFTNINWGSDQVLFETRQKLQQLGWEWDELNILRDIDTPVDLLDFPEIIDKAGLTLKA
jgi:rSAM/selenodomain-associated transferase 1